MTVIDFYDERVNAGWTSFFENEVVGEAALLERGFSEPFFGVIPSFAQEWAKELKDTGFEPVSFWTNGAGRYAWLCRRTS